MMIRPLPGQLLKDRWESTPMPMSDPTYLMMLQVQALTKAYNKLEVAYNRHTHYAELTITTPPRDTPQPLPVEPKA